MRSVIGGLLQTHVWLLDCASWRYWYRQLWYWQGACLCCVGHSRENNRVATAKIGLAWSEANFPLGVVCWPVVVECVFSGLSLGCLMLVCVEVVDDLTWTALCAGFICTKLRDGYRSAHATLQHVLHVSFIRLVSSWCESAILLN